LNAGTMQIFLKLRISGEWMRAATTKSAVPRLRCTEIYPHKTNIISGTIFPQTVAQFTQSKRGYALPF